MSVNFTVGRKSTATPNSGRWRQSKRKHWRGVRGKTRLPRKRSLPSFLDIGSGGRNVNRPEKLFRHDRQPTPQNRHQLPRLTKADTA